MERLTCHTYSQYLRKQKQWEERNGGDLQCIHGRERYMRTMEYISCCNVLLPENGVRSRRSESKSLFLNYSINDDANLLEKPFLTLALFLKQDFNLWIDSNAVSRWKEAWLLRVAFDPPFGTLLILSYTQFRLHFRVFKTSCFWIAADIDVFGALNTWMQKLAYE